MKRHEIIDYFITQNKILSNKTQISTEFNVFVQIFETKSYFCSKI